MGRCCYRWSCLQLPVIQLLTIFKFVTGVRIKATGESQLIDGCEKAYTFDVSCIALFVFQGRNQVSFLKVSNLLGEHKLHFILAQF